MTCAGPASMDAGLFSAHPRRMDNLVIFQAVNIVCCIQHNRSRLWPNIVQQFVTFFDGFPVDNPM